MALTKRDTSVGFEELCQSRLRRAFGFRQEDFDDLKQIRQVLSDKVLDGLTVNGVVPMRQDISEGHDARRVADASCCLWVGPT